MFPILLAITGFAHCGSPYAVKQVKSNLSEAAYY